MEVGGWVQLSKKKLENRPKILSLLFEFRTVMGFQKKSLDRRRVGGWGEIYPFF